MLALGSDRVLAIKDFGRMRRGQKNLYPSKGTLMPRANIIADGNYLMKQKRG
jgi:hypothetical protein